MVIGIFFLAMEALGATVLTESERKAEIAARVEAGCLSLEREMANNNEPPSVRHLTACALALLELGKEPARAEKLLRRTFGLQVMAASSADYGNIPWREGRPDIKDPNAIEFTMQSVGVIWLRHGEKFPRSFKQEMEPHLRAAIAAIRRHDVAVQYSNIYLMKLVNLLLLGQAVGDDSAMAEGKKNFETWLAVTQTTGISEYDSPIYSSIQADTLALAHNLTSDLVLKASLKRVLDFYWADFAANYFPGRQTMTGPASRNYNLGFVFSDPNIEYAYYLVGLRSARPGDTLLCDLVRSWTAATMGGYRPSAETLATANVPERVVRSMFGSKPGQDRYVWITPEVSIGSASAFHGFQDRRICAEFASAKRLPIVNFVVDALDSPFGLARAVDRSGHVKPHHVPHVLATVQEKGFLLALMDLSPGIQNGEFTNLASNVTLPVRVDQWVVDGRTVNTAKPFALPADSRTVVGMREGKGAIAVRLFAADGCKGQGPTWKVEFDGNDFGGGRFLVQHYRGLPGKLAEGPVRCGLILMAARCEDDAAFGAFLKQVGEIELSENDQDDKWEVKAKSGSTVLEAGLDLRRHEITTRKVNGTNWITKILTVNDRDWAQETLGARPPSN